MRLRSFLFSIFVTAALLRCAEHAPVVDPHPIAPTPPAIAPVDGGSPQTVALLEPLDAGADSGSDTATAMSKPSVDPSQWLDAREVPKADRDKFKNASDCEEAIVGTAREPALVCTISETAARNLHTFPMGRVLWHRTANVARAKKIVKVLDVLVALGPLDFRAARNPDVVDLALHIAPDGLSAKLDEHTEIPGTKCADARAANQKDLKENRGTMRDVAVFDRDLIARVCGSIGELEWKKDRFVRRIFTDALPMGAPKENSGFGTIGF